MSRAVRVESTVHLHMFSVDVPKCIVFFTNFSSFFDTSKHEQLFDPCLQSTYQKDFTKN